MSDAIIKRLTILGRHDFLGRTPPTKATTESPKFNQGITQDISMDSYFIIAAAAILTGLISWQLIQALHRRNRGAD